MSTNFDVVLSEVMAEHGFACGLVASSSGQVLARSGEFTALRWPDLATSLFGDQDAVVRLDESLQEQTLPQIFRQGEVMVLVMKPRADLVVGFFDQSGRDVARLYRQGQQIDRVLSQRLDGPP